MDAQTIGNYQRTIMTTIATLAQQLADYKAGFLQRATPERVATMAGATTDLKATGIESPSA